MKLKLFPLVPVFLALFAIACSKEEIDDPTPSTPPISKTEEKKLEIEEFIYAGLNEIYLYKSDISELDDNYFETDTKRKNYLEKFSSPEKLFKALKSSQDRFSFLTDDYNKLEESFEGTSSSTAGMEFGLGRISGSNYIFGFLQYVIPGTSADDAGLLRGNIFTEVDGKKLTMSNFESLMNADSFTINVGTVENNSIVLSDKTVTLTHDSYTANPVHLIKILEVDGQKVGYLMYNSFISNFDAELNAAFAELKAAGITNLVLDLRYNGGGSVDTALALATMITGQFEGQVFMKEQWNEKYQAYFEKNDPNRLINRFKSKLGNQQTINSLNLSKVYILTTQSTASASELIINGLEPYVDVVQIGDFTTGKFQASVTLYDSDDFDREGASPNHTYAMQPLVFKSSNAAGRSDYVDGLAPDIKVLENIADLGILGDYDEPLLSAALAHIQGKSQQARKQMEAMTNMKIVGDGSMYKLDYQRMYINKVPDIFKRSAK